MGLLTEVSSNKCFNGLQKVFSHESTELKCKMNFGVFLPAPALENVKLPIVYWLSGLTCSEANFIQKSGAQRYAAEHNLIVVNPDTSPRGCGIDGESDSWDFGVGAGFYLDATEPKWNRNYRMFSYVTKELPKLISENFPILTDRQGIFGHSMGGHGALICALKTNQYRSVSAFAPICNPSNCPWGQKAFGGYLGVENKSAWDQYDSTKLAVDYKGSPMEILIDQGGKDEFLEKKQLLPEALIAATKGTQISVNCRLQPGYDHSYFFISSFIGDHFAHHARLLKS